MLNTDIKLNQTVYTVHNEDNVIEIRECKITKKTPKGLKVVVEYPDGHRMTFNANYQKKSDGNYYILSFNHEHNSRHILHLSYDDAYAYAEQKVKSRNNVLIDYINGGVEASKSYLFKNACSEELIEEMTKHIKDYLVEKQLTVLKTPTKGE